MKIYIATKFENQHVFQDLKAKLEANGHTITHDWTKESDAGMPMPYAALYRQGCAIKDVWGASSADCLILIPVAKPMAGAFVELGIMLGKNSRLGGNQQIIIVDAFNEDFQRNIFYYLPEIVHVKTIDQAIEVCGTNNNL